METTTFKNLMLLTSITFFTACSNHAPKADKLTTLELMGISTDLQPVVLHPRRDSQSNNLPMARTFPLEERTYTVQERYIEPTAFTPSPSNNVYMEPTVFTPSASNNVYIEDPLTVVRNVEEHAKELLGIKYVWGATGPNTYDCSGFTQKIYRDAGINIPRVSRDQARVGQFVSYNNLRRGDMVFFDTKKRRTGKVSHVGIYLGGGNFIHASSAAKKIVIYNFNEKTFYKKRFLWGRRVIRDNYFMASL